MKTITVQIDDFTFNELTNQSAKDGRSVEDLVAVALWQQVQRSIEPINGEDLGRPSRIPLVLNCAVTFLIASMIVVQLIF
jgi:hypothetical protein